MALKVSNYFLYRLFVGFNSFFNFFVKFSNDSPLRIGERSLMSRCFLLEPFSYVNLGRIRALKNLGVEITKSQQIERSCHTLFE